ncbi:hypothetical protein INT44_000748 [Umbelopsis vinacea]|uniref:Uncharacterized protein n=1 Tax=Umbelopsis vinacea TaxID=44442 RepID=A0A8H7Q8V5_9FUNG|nr:hypothetical protein INT44_000748 [Umbelopsis vinacea]
MQADSLNPWRDPPFAISNSPVHTILMWRILLDLTPVTNQIWVLPATIKGKHSLGEPQTRIVHHQIARASFHGRIIAPTPGHLKFSPCDSHSKESPSIAFIANAFGYRKHLDENVPEHQEFDWASFMRRLMAIEVLQYALVNGSHVPSGATQS